MRLATSSESIVFAIRLFIYFFFHIYFHVRNKLCKNIYMQKYICKNIVRL